MISTRFITSKCTSPSETESTKLSDTRYKRRGRGLRKKAQDAEIDFSHPSASSLAPRHLGCVERGREEKVWQNDLSILHMRKKK